MNSINQRKWTVTAIATVLVGTAALFTVKLGKDGIPQEPNQGKRPTEPVSAIQPSALNVTAPVQEDVFLKPSVSEPPSADGEAPALREVQVRANDVLASVGGVAISPKDLMSSAVADEQSMSAEMYNYLLSRAINREVVFQTARSQGVELTPEQQQQLAEIRAALEKQDAAVVQQLTVTPATVEFDIRDTTGLMLQANLAERAGVPLPHVTPAQVEGYYQSRKDVYGELPTDPVQRAAAWQTIDSNIRQKLSPEIQAAYQEKLRQFLDQIKSSAKITLAANTH